MKWHDTILGEGRIGRVTGHNMTRHSGRAIDRYYNTTAYLFVAAQHRIDLTTIHSLFNKLHSNYYSLHFNQNTTHLTYQNGVVK